MPKALFAVLADAPGGAERVIATAAAELAGRPGWAVEIMSIARRTDASFLEQIDPRVRVSYGPGRDSLPAMVMALRRAPQSPYDLVFSSHFRLNVGLSLARKLGWLRTRRLVTRESTVFADRATGAGLATYRALYRLYGAQDEIWAQTAYMAKRLREMITPAAHKVRVVPNPVDLAAIRKAGAAAPAPAIASFMAERPCIAWCGRMIPIKNPALAIQAFGEARRLCGQDLGLVMIGEGPELDSAQALAEALGLGDRVLFTGRLANPHPVFAAAKLGLLTSVREGFPNVLLEMMAAGVPYIVTTACAGDLDTLTGVEVIEDASPKALGGALARGAAASEDRRLLHQAALRIRDPGRFVDALVGLT